MTIGLFAEMYFVGYSFGSTAWLLAPCGFIIVSTIGMSYAANDVEVRLFDFDARLAFFKNLVDVASGIEHIRAFGYQRQFLRRTYDLLNASQRTHYYALLMEHSLTLSVDLFVMCAALIVTGVPLCFGLSTQATMGISLITVVGLSTFTKDVIDSWSRLTAALAPAYHICKFISGAPRPKQIVAASFDAADTSIRWPISGGIEFENVTAHRYVYAILTKSFTLLLTLSQRGYDGAYSQQYQCDNSSWENSRHHWRYCKVGMRSILLLVARVS